MLFGERAPRRGCLEQPQANTVAPASVQRENLMRKSLPVQWAATIGFALLGLGGCLALATSPDTSGPREEFCDPIVDYCLLYPDTLKRAARLQEENGLRLKLEQPACQVTVRGFKNALYPNMRAWYEYHLREAEAKYQNFRELESSYTEDLLVMQLVLDGALHLIKVHRLEERRWVVSRLRAPDTNQKATLTAIWNRVDVVPNL